MLRVDRLHKVMVEPVFPGAVRVGRGVVAGQGEQQHGTAVRLLANPPGDLVTAHPRKTDVDDPHVRTRDVQRFEAADAVGRPRT